MSILKDLMAKGKEMTLSNGAVITIKPLTVRQEAEFAQMQIDKKFGDAIKFLAEETLRNSVTDVTDDEIQNINKEDLKKVIEVAMDVNGLKGKDEKK